MAVAEARVATERIGSSEAEVARLARVAVLALDVLLAATVARVSRTDGLVVFTSLHTTLALPATTSHHQHTIHP